MGGPREPERFVRSFPDEAAVFVGDLPMCCQHAVERAYDAILRREADGNVTARCDHQTGCGRSWENVGVLRWKEIA